MILLLVSAPVSFAGERRVDLSPPAGGLLLRHFWSNNNQDCLLMACPFQTDSNPLSVEAKRLRRL